MNIAIHDVIPGCTNFTWGEALYLPQWNIHVLPDPAVEANILHMAPTMQKIRDILDRPMLVTSWYRPFTYNKLIGGAGKSWHTTGGAVDFRCPHVSADETRIALRPLLEDLNIRMEDLDGSNWVHIDNKEPKVNRYFKP